MDSLPQLARRRLVVVAQAEEMNLMSRAGQGPCLVGNPRIGREGLSRSIPTRSGRFTVCRSPSRMWTIRSAA